MVKSTIDTYNFLKLQSDLSPRNEDVNLTFCNFFRQIKNNNTPEVAAAFFQDQKIKNVHQKFMNLCQSAEERMEYFFAEGFSNRKNLTYFDLKEFWYWDSYFSLTCKEINILTENIEPISVTGSGKVAFVGQGPLPLTMLIFHQETCIPCVGVDIENSATEYANLLSQKIGFHSITNDVCDGALYDYSNTPIIFLASMIPNKKAVLERILETRDNKPTLVNVRTAENLSTLLYQPFDLQKDLPGPYQILGKTEFDNKTINTTYCLKI